MTVLRNKVRQIITRQKILTKEIKPRAVETTQNLSKSVTGKGLLKVAEKFNLPLKNVSFNGQSLDKLF